MIAWTKPSASLVRNILSLTGMLIAAMTILVVLYNMYASMKGLPALYRVTISILLFAFGFAVTVSNKRIGLRACLFLLPLLPNLTFQILSYSGYGRILHQDASGLDLISGFICGALIHRLLVTRDKERSWLMPWPAALLLVTITLSVVLAIARNLSQTSASFNASALLYTLTHIRAIGWHDDYRPLFDWVAYGAALAFFATLLPILKNSENRDSLVFKPLLFGVLVAAIVGLIQNRFGIGLTPSQLQFRSTTMSYGHDVFGFSAIGFQPDIHAFAGHLMLGAVGLLGYMYYSKEQFARYVIPLVVMPLSFIAMLASKSKSSVALTVLFLLIFILLWIFRRSRYLMRVVTFFAVSLLLLFFSMYLFQDAWAALLTLFAKRLGFADLYAMNFSMAFRPEIYIAAFRMLSDMPLMGLGQGDFYRLSAIPSFSQSPFLTETLNGENAHNYFIQVLAENGLIGFAVFTLFVFYPCFKASNKKTLIPALVGLGSVFLGNMYAHSLLVRENLLICSGLVALMYAWVLNESAMTSSSGNHTNLALNTRSSRQHWLIASGLVLITIISIFSAKEMIQSFKRPPFTTDYQCYKNTGLTQDSWTSGRFVMNLPDDAQGVRISLQSLQPDASKRPLGIVLMIVDDDKQPLVTQKFSFKENTMSVMEALLPDNAQTSTKPKKIVLITDRCFVPKNSGMGGDDRRLGVRIKTIDYLHK